MDEKGRNDVRWYFFFYFQPDVNFIDPPVDGRCVYRCTDMFVVHQLESGMSGQNSEWSGEKFFYFVPRVGDFIID